MYLQDNPDYNHNVQVGNHRYLIHHNVVAPEHRRDYGRSSAHQSLSWFWEVETPTLDMVLQLQMLNIEPVGYLPHEKDSDYLRVAIEF